MELNAPQVPAKLQLHAAALIPPQLVELIKVPVRSVLQLEPPKPLVPKLLLLLLPQLLLVEHPTSQLLTALKLLEPHPSPSPPPPLPPLSTSSTDL